MNLSRSLYRHLIRPVFFQMDPEKVHEFAMLWLRFLSANPWLMNLLSRPNDPRLERTVFGVKFPNPIGLAAGFDKNAVALPAWAALGFGFVEAGTITAKAQPGNPKPRIFRLPEMEAVINRMGFNNDGSEALAARFAALEQSGRWPKIPVGVNIGKTKVTPLEEATSDYLFSFEKLYRFGDYFVLNVSSPNTPGLRTLQNKDSLAELFQAIQAKNRELAPVGGLYEAAGGHSPASKIPAPKALKPVLVKIAPDLEFAQIEEILGLIDEHKIAGIIATNTTLDHSSVPEGRDQQGGLSGKPVRKRSTEIVKFIASKTKVPIIAVGGIDDVDSAKEKLDAGASLIQLYTGFIFQGPSLPSDICRGL
jgi:dihydroorotate dehydrogenase